MLAAVTPVDPAQKMRGADLEGMVLRNAVLGASTGNARVLGTWAA